MIKKIQTLVATGAINNNDVSLNWFNRGRDGYTEVTHAELNSTGGYPEWPADFADTEMKLEEAYLKAVYSQDNA